MELDNEGWIELWNLMMRNRTDSGSELEDLITLDKIQNSMMSVKLGSDSKLNVKGQIGLGFRF